MSWITGVDLEAEQRRSDELDAKNRALTQKRYEEGKVTDQAYAISMQHYADGQMDVSGEVNQAFVDGAKEGLDNVLEAPGKVVDAIGKGATKTLGGILGGIPLWVWPVALIVAFFALGGAGLLRAGVAYAGRKVASAA